MCYSDTSAILGDLINTTDFHITSPIRIPGGVYATDLHNVTVQLDGTLRFLPGRKGWPLRPAGDRQPLH